ASINFDTVHIANTDLKKHTDKSILEGKPDIVDMSDMLDFEKGQWVFTLSSTSYIDIGSDLPCIEITVASKFVAHELPTKQTNFNNMVEAHYFHSQAIITNELLKAGYGERYLFIKDSSIQKRALSLEDLQNRL
ncbi:MAG: hypothetical protein ABI729_08885, partial [Chitinophagales bacterium]